MSKTIRQVGVCAFALALIAASPGLAQQADDDAPKQKRGKKWMEDQIEALAEAQDEARAEIDALKEGQQAIQKQLQEIKRLVQQQGRPQPTRRQGPEVKDVAFNLGDNDVKGHSDAKLTLIEFTDYQ
jgi:hypothetical protein